MNTHDWNDAIERYSMGTLPVAERGELEKHLLQCDECQAAVTEMDSFLTTYHEAARSLADSDEHVRAVNRLSVTPIDHPTVLPFLTHLPQYSLEAAAGKFGKRMDIEPEGWVEVHTDIPLSDDMFVTHVTGHSMEPKIPDSSLCAFRAKIIGPWDGKVILVEQLGESGGNRYTVQTWHVSKNADPNLPGDEAWLHKRVTLEPLNPAYKAWDVASAENIRVLGEFLFVV